MNSELLGLIDTLEATVLEGKRILLTEQVIINEKKILQIIDKIRLVLSKEESFIRNAVEIKNKEEIVIVNKNTQQSVSDVSLTSGDKKETEEAEKIKKGANEYADYVLANLHLMISKMQKQIVKLEKTIENGREVLDGHKNLDGQESEKVKTLDNILT